MKTDSTAITNRTIRVGAPTTALGAARAAVAIEAMARAGLRARHVGIAADPSGLGDEAIGEATALEAALLDDSIDAAVTALDGAAADPSSGLRISATLRRWSPLRALISHNRAPLSRLPAASVVAADGDEVAAQVVSSRADLVVTRGAGGPEDLIRRVREGDLDAAIVSFADLAWLGRVDEADQIVSVSEVAPPAGAGALGLLIRSDDLEAAAILARVDHPLTAQAVLAERVFAEAVRDATGFAVAASAAVHSGVVLFGRAVPRDGAERIDVEERAVDPRRAAEAAARAIAFRAGRRRLAVA